MNCESVRDRLIDYLERELDPADASAFEDHLRGCEACRAEEQGTRELLSQLVADAAKPADPGERYWAAFAGRVRTTIAARAEREAPRGWFSSLTPRLVFAASLALIVVVALFTFPKASGDDDALYASIVPSDPAALTEAVGQLSDAEADRFESTLLADARGAAKKPTAIATPTPTPKPAASPAGAKKSDSLDSSVAPHGLQDDLSDLDELTPEELDQLLTRLGAMKT